MESGSGWLTVAEVYQKAQSLVSSTGIRELAIEYLKQTGENIRPNSGNRNRFGPYFLGHESLQEHVEAIDVVRTPAKRDETTVYVVKLDDQGGHDGCIEMDGEEIQAASQIILPSKDLHGIWDNLIYGDDVKERLLRYVFTAMKLSDSGVDPNLVSWNRLVLLHGPPGTGKTSLCRALAQKLSVRLSDRFDYGYLVEVNSHSLFSKWFSESGKLVQKMFSHVQELIDDPCAFVCVLIDEVESLAAARKASSSEPSDAIRVVNAVLTQIDTIKQHNNVLIMTTSNITGTIDLAFVDRADIKQYIGPPGAEACYGMLSGSLEELKVKGLITTDDIIFQALSPLKNMANGGDSIPGSDLSRSLWEEAKRCAGLSGRSLRKLPFLALTEFQSYPVSGQDFMSALHRAIDQHKNSKTDQ